MKKSTKKALKNTLTLADLAKVKGGGGGGAIAPTAYTQEIRSAPMKRQ